VQHDERVEGIDGVGGAYRTAKAAAKIAVFARQTEIVSPSRSSRIRPIFILRISPAIALR